MDADKLTVQPPPSSTPTANHTHGIFPIADVREVRAVTSALFLRSKLWWVTVACFILAFWLTWTSIPSVGPTITIRFPDGHGLKAGDAVRHRGIEAGIVDRRFTVIMRVLRKNVRLTKASQSETAAKRLKEDVPRSLIKANDDYQETLEVVKKTLTEELPIFNGKLSEFYEAVSDAEELGVTRLTSLHKEIETDRWLLSTERKELLEAVTAQEELFLQRLLKLVEQVENNAKGGQVI